MVKRTNKVIIVVSLILIVFVVTSTIRLMKEQCDEPPKESEIFTDIEYDEIYCEFIALNKKQITVMVDTQEKNFEIYSPFKFFGITQGTDIVLLVPKNDSKKVAIKIQNESILN